MGIEGLKNLIDPEHVGPTEEDRKQAEENKRFWGTKDEEAERKS